MGQADPKLLAEGDLSATPALHILLHLEQRALSGTLLLLHSERRNSDRVLFMEGRPTAGLFVGGASSLLSGLLAVCARTQGPYAFLGADLLSAHNTSLRGAIDTFAVVAQVCRNTPPEGLVDGVLTRYGDYPMRLQPGRPLHRLQLTADENLVVDLLRAAPASTSDLVCWSPLPAQATRALLYLLVVTRMVAPYARDSQPAKSGSRMTVVPMPSSIFPSRHSVPSGGSGPSPGVRASVAPGAAGGHGSGPRRPIPSRSLSPAEQRGVLAKLRRAEERIQSGRAEAALELIDGVLRDDPRNPCYLGWRAYALISETRSRERQEVPSDVSAAIKEALLADEREPRALYAQGLAFLQVGKLKRALQFIRRAAEADPEFVPAVRDARSLEQRLQRLGRTR